ncbi:pitrilysin family protein [Rhodocytophaga aerolata]
MKKNLQLVGILSLLSITMAFGQTKLVEKVTKKGNELVIPYEKYVLPNGLKLVIHEDHSDPVVHVDVTYHVGSAREEVGKSGFAHFFEHMMFQGSDHVADEEHFKIVTESGGSLNGSTNNDRTNYYETVPNNQLELMLWLEADRMGFFLDAVTQKKFEIQRATVKNERGQGVDNAPYGPIWENLSRTLYPYNHPYAWPVIGYLEDLDRADVNDLKRFFLRWYGPNNATLTVGGDVKPQEVVRMVEKYFGSIPKGPAVAKDKQAPIVLNEDRYISYVDNNAPFPALVFDFPTVPSGHPDEPALSCLADIIGEGKSSFLYQKFVKTQKAIQSSIFNNNNELAGEIIMFVLPFPGKSLAEFETEMREALVEFEKAGVTDENIQKFKAKYEANKIKQLESVGGKVSTLAYYETFRDNPNYLMQELKAYRAVTKADVLRVYNQYMKGKKAVVLSVLTKDQSGNVIAAAKPDNYKVPKQEYKSVNDPNESLTYVKGKDTFDRSKRPGSGANPVVNVPEFWTDKFSNGMKVIGSRNDELPMVYLQLTINGGHMLSASEPQKAGIASLTAKLLGESTKKYTAEQMNDELDKLGSTIYTYASKTGTTIGVQSLVKNLDATLAFMQEKLFNPKFSQEDFERIKRQQLESIKGEENVPSSIADNVYYKTVYGKSHIFGVPTEGTMETVGAITLEDVQKFYASYYSPSVSELVIVGDITKEAALAKLDFLKNWSAKEVQMPTLAASAPVEKAKIYLVDKKQAPQSEIRVGYLTNIPFDATGEYYRMGLMNFSLGGSFNSRINLNLREDKGYTYGSWSYFDSSKIPGPYTVSAGVKANTTDSSVVEIVKELTNFNKSGITDDELVFTKNSIGQVQALKYETLGQKAGFLSNIIKYDLDKDFVKQQNEILKNMTKEEINSLAGKHLPMDKMAIAVVGDKELVKPGLERLGFEIIELDTNGEPVPVVTAPAPSTQPALEAPAGAASPATEKKKKKK